MSATPVKPKARDVGIKAEQQALQFLQSQGMKPVQRNYHCRFGEIDLILWDKDTLVFAEVRYRKHKNFGSGAESIDSRKQQKLLASAAYYLQQQPKLSRHPCRFDVVSISGTALNATDADHHNMNIDWIPNAFQAG
ncbi:MAG: YraN family protein [Gammaproteobacteria bacterium]|jgi:putative endonuclease